MSVTEIANARTEPKTAPVPRSNRHSTTYESHFTAALLCHTLAAHFSHCTCLCHGPPWSTWPRRTGRTLLARHPRKNHPVACRADASEDVTVGVTLRPLPCHSFLFLFSFCFPLKKSACAEWLTRLSQKLCSFRLLFIQF